MTIMYASNYKNPDHVEPNNICYEMQVYRFGEKTFAANSCPRNREFLQQQKNV